MPGFSIQKDPNAAKKAAIAAAKGRASLRPEDAAIIKYVKAELTAERMRVVFDDSGSMSSEIKNAKDGVTEFFRNCVPNTSACSVHFLCTDNEEAAVLSVLDADLPRKAQQLDSINLRLGGTPLFGKLKEVVQLPLTTRIIAFTDGSPTDAIVESDNQYLASSTLDRYKKNADVIIALAVERHIPIDTVYFGGDYAENEIALLKYLSEKTGGFFLHFNPAKVSFAKAFKYLAPVHRKQLMSPSFRAELEAGKKD